MPARAFAPLRDRAPTSPTSFVEELLEARDVPRLAAQLVVEAQHLGDEPGPSRSARRPSVATASRAADCSITSRSYAVRRRGRLSSRA